MSEQADDGGVSGARVRLTDLALMIARLEGKFDVVNLGMTSMSEDVKELKAEVGKVREQQVADTQRISKLEEHRDSLKAGRVNLPQIVIAGVMAASVVISVLVWLKK